MATLKQFEDIEAWRKARELNRAIYQCTKTGEFSRDYGLRDPIRRASVSVMSNIAEGFERGGTTEFIHFLSIAKASVGEMESQLYIAFDQTYVNEEQFQSLKALAGSTKRLIAGLMHYLRQSGFKGDKYK